MKKIVVVLLILGIWACGGEKKDTSAPKKAKKEVALHNQAPASERIDLQNKGVGPITELILSESIDQDMAKKGEKIYNAKCVACHKTNAKFIGPAPKDILKRRSPEWVMNMILAPAKMLKEDPLAKELLIEFNNTPMLSQGVNEEQARQILEYFRTL